jgi:membrane protein implicated in regulation of membrane protease activity
MPELLFLFPIVALMTGYVAHTRGRSFWSWFAVSCLLPIVSFMILLLLRNNQKKQEEGNLQQEHLPQPKNK